MKIAALAGSQIPSDTANSLQVMKACSALVQLGHDLTLIVPENSSILNRKSEIVNLKSHYGLQTDFPIEWLPSSNRRLFTWQSVQRARALQPDLIYSWMIQSAVFGLLFKFPTVFEIHIQPTGTLGPAWHRAFAMLRGRKRLASITQALVDVLERRRHIRFKPDEVVIAPNGVDLERFASLPSTPEPARQTLNLPSAPIVMCTGHLYAGRGADLFLALAREIPQAHFIWVGGRPADVEAWKARAESDNITFTGFVPNQELPLWQAAADLLLMPYSRFIMGSSGSADSASVASPMKMFEYMAAGRAIVTADLPVIREVLNEKNAVFCEPDDVEDWKSKIGKLLADKPRRLALGRQAGNDVQGYTWRARAEKIMRGWGNQ
ncbi:MAG: glycosyltransferase family 4 protein [Chloroflexi bacterium]|nr:glycosyltransferase family 4 protein [Chloroflexota bacterium]